MPPAAVTLDAVGTLFELVEPVGVTYARIGARHGIVVTPDAVEPAFGAAVRAAPPLAFPGLPPPALVAAERDWWLAVVRQAFGAVAAHPAFGACFADLYAHYAGAGAWRVHPDVRPALATLRAAGRRIGVVSNFDGRLQGILEGLGLGTFLDVIVPSARAGAAKPAVAIFAGALARLGVAPTATLHAGDTVDTDVAGALAAGVPVVLVDRGRRRPALPPTVRTITSLAELPRLSV
jgi:putative hydrolase of the HAD superfamily